MQSHGEPEVSGIWASYPASHIKSGLCMNRKTGVAWLAEVLLGSKMQGIKGVEFDIFIYF